MTAFPDGYRSFAACIVDHPRAPRAPGHVVEAKTVVGNQVVYVGFHDGDRTFDAFPAWSVTGENVARKPGPSGPG